MRSVLTLGLFGSASLLSVLCLGQTNPPQHTSPGSAVVEASSLNPHACNSSDWGLLETAETKALLSDFDFDPFVPGRCTAADVKWLPSARVVRLIAVSARVDDFREITLLRASPNSRLWLIPIEKGMVGYSETPNNPHHLAAFNDLLRVAQLKINDHNLFEVSDLYQFLVGMEMKSNPQPEAIKDALSVNDIAGLTEHGDGFIDFTHREPLGDSWSSEYMVWEFRYSTSGKFSRLTDVERKTLKDYEDEK